MVTDEEKRRTLMSRTEIDRNFWWAYGILVTESFDQATEIIYADSMSLI